MRNFIQWPADKELLFISREDKDKSERQTKTKFGSVTNVIARHPHAHLTEHVARWQSHFAQVNRIPRSQHDPAIVWVRLDLLDDASELIYTLTCDNLDPLLSPKADLQKTKSSDSPPNFRVPARTFKRNSRSDKGLWKCINRKNYKNV